MGGKNHQTYIGQFQDVKFQLLSNLKIRCSLIKRYHTPFVALI